MSREAHVRFCERLGVKLPRPTHPYVATWQGFIYVAFVIGVFARRIVGWRVSSSARSRTSGENFGDFFMAPSSQKLEPPPSPARFSFPIFPVSLERLP